MSSVESCQHQLSGCSRCRRRLGFSHIFGIKRSFLLAFGPGSGEASSQPAMDFSHILQQTMAGNGQQQHQQQQQQVSDFGSMLDVGAERKKQGPPMDFTGYSFNGSQFTQHIPTMPQSTLPAVPAPQFNMPETQPAEPDKVRKSRKRQQTSCSACHRRKQKCNKVSALLAVYRCEAENGLRMYRKSRVIGASKGV